ncbi:hypothetical protein JTB14_020983 [Gonioctena quinquepunctata]|nr:hypothetical protein JTB14_020983 [Gonioctena quinquepunctata]
MVFIEVFVLCCIYSVSAEEFPNTVRTYTLDVPGSDPIQIIEGDPLWGGQKGTTKSLPHFDHRKFTTSPSPTNLNDPLSSERVENSSEFSPEVLQDFLNNYAEKVKKDKRGGTTDATGNPPPEEKGKKSWNLLNVRHHNHPYDDKTGWVSLDAVPWSISKISKWQSKPNPAENYWNSYHPTERPYADDFDEFHISTSNKYKPQTDKNYQGYNLQGGNKPNRIRPSFTKPEAVYGNAVHLQLSPGHNNKQEGYHNHGQNCNHEEGVILTDGQLPNFPNREYTNRRLGSESHPPTHPFTGNGDWVLLSTSTGYKYPKKQRSIKLNPSSVNTHKSVHLTVLPPLKGSKVNMTTSHGGMLQVESTFESVEQSQKKQQKLQKPKRKRKRPTKFLKKKRPQAPRVVTESAIATIPRSTGSDGDSSAVLAGVGAGLIPATMAMLVPLAMNGKRRKREIFSTSLPTTVEMNLSSSY